MNSNIMAAVVCLFAVLCSTVSMFAMLMVGWHKPVYVVFVFEHFCMVFVIALFLVAFEHVLRLLVAAIHFRFDKTSDSVKEFWANRNVYMVDNGAAAILQSANKAEVREDKSNNSAETNNPLPSTAVPTEDPSFSNLSQILQSNEGTPTFANDVKFELPSSDGCSAATTTSA
jgi:hypothetical protein